MFGITGFWVYIIIFCVKMIEVSFSTVRVILIGKNKKLVGVLMGFVEVSIWVVLTSSVLSDVTSDPLKAVAFCVAQCCGLVIGASIEQKLAIGLTSIQIVVSQEEGEKLGETLRDNGFGVTLMDAHSVGGTPRTIILLQLRRRRVSEAVSVARQYAPNAVISVSDVSSVSGGYVK